MNLLLDTCTFLWLAQQPSEISSVAAEAIDDPTSTLLLSDTSIWEITLKNRAGKLPLPEPPRSWIPKKIAFHQLQQLDIDLDSIYRSGELPFINRDPFDRLLAAQALTKGLTILSPHFPLSALGAARLW